MSYRILNQSFLGNRLRKNTSYTIIGGGISALMLGFYLKRAGYDFKIIEKTTLGGGLLGTHHHPYGLSEQAANGFIWCEELQEMADVLNLRILEPKTTANARYLVRNKRLKRWPLSVGESLHLLWNLTKSPKGQTQTVYDFGIQYLGKSVTEQVLEPAFAGIYGADIVNLSFPGVLSRLAEALNGHPNLFRAAIKLRKTAKARADKKKRSGTHSFINGMGELVEGLERFLSKHIEYGRDGLALRHQKDFLIITTPAYIAADFFEDELATLLRAIRYTSIISCTLFFEKKHLKRFKEGFGCLIPRNEGLHILGVLFNSSIFDFRVKEEHLVSLTCIMRDDIVTHRFLNYSDEQLIQLIIGELDQLFGVQAPPLATAIYRWAHGIPLYSPELYQGWFKIDELLTKNYPNRNLFGNYTGEISIRGLCQMAKKAVVFS